MEQLLAHLIGDYLWQPHWMATQKTKRLWVAALHALIYTLPFVCLTANPWALTIIAGSHCVIDRYRLARLVGWLKNQLGPPTTRRPWSECSATGYDASVPPHLATLLLIVTDNTLHLLINYLALRWLP